MNKEELLKEIMKLPKVETDTPISAYGSIDVDDLKSAIDRFDKVPDYGELLRENKKQKEVIDDCKEDISNLFDIINKNCNELKCTSDEWLVIQKYQDKEVQE